MKRGLAEELLLAALEDGPVPQAVLVAVAVAYTVAPRTLRRAARALGVRSYQRGRRWWWGRRNQTEQEGGATNLAT